MENNYLFKEFFEAVKEGDEIITVVNWSKKTRKVFYQFGAIVCEGYRYQWNDFFTHNTPMKIV